MRFISGICFFPNGKRHDSGRKLTDQLWFLWGKLYAVDFPEIADASIPWMIAVESGGDLF